MALACGFGARELTDKPSDKELSIMENIIHDTFIKDQGRDTFVLPKYDGSRLENALKKYLGKDEHGAEVSSLKLSELK